MLRFVYLIGGFVWSMFGSYVLYHTDWPWWVFGLFLYNSICLIALASIDNG